MRTVVLFALLGVALIALTAIVKEREETAAARNAYQTGAYHKANGMKYDDSSFSELPMKRAYAFGWIADTD
jgi:hypothetical protein